MRAMKEPYKVITLVFNTLPSSLGGRNVIPIQLNSVRGVERYWVA